MYIKRRRPMDRCLWTTEQMVETSQANARKVAFQQRTLTRCLTRPFNCVSKIKKKKKKKRCSHVKNIYIPIISISHVIFKYHLILTQISLRFSPPLSFLAKNFSLHEIHNTPLFLLLLLIFFIKCLNNYFIFMYLYKNY